MDGHVRASHIGGFMRYRYFLAVGVSAVLLYGLSCGAALARPILGFDKHYVTGGALAYAGNGRPMRAIDVPLDRLFTDTRNPYDDTFACRGCVMNITTGTSDFFSHEIANYESGGRLTIEGTVVETASDRPVFSGLLVDGAISDGYIARSSGVRHATVSRVFGSFSMAPDLASVFGFTATSPYFMASVNGFSSTFGDDGSIHAENLSAYFDGDVFAAPNHDVPEPRLLFVLALCLIGLGENRRRKRQLAASPR